MPIYAFTSLYSLSYFITEPLIYLKNFKSVIMSLTRNLRSDLKKLKKELIELERNELDMLLEMGKEYSM